jgi:predicted alpha-1,2-mannosidase
MMNSRKMLLLVFLAFFTQQVSLAQAKAPIDYVSTLMGTDSKYSLSNGNTYPLIGVPWGMHYWTPQTGKNGDGWQYAYSADKIVGFKQTHQPSPWMNDYGQFSIMPVLGLNFTEDKRASWFSHKSEIATPYYYSVYLADAAVTAELTPTERAALMRFTYPASDSAFVVVDAYHKGSYIKIIPEQKKIIGYSTKNSGGVPAGFKNYFIIYFDKAFTVSKTWRDKTLVADSLEINAEHAGAIIGFKTSKREAVNLRIASSFISFEQAEINLQKELSGKSFETIKQESKNAWSKQMNKIKVEGGTEDQRKTFYSCLYRTIQFPQKQYEIAKDNSIIHYSPYNGKTLPGFMFAGTGFWDTFRALYPFLNLVYPSINVEMQQGLINDYKEGGWLPEWSSPGYRNVMIGNNSASVVADAYIKGRRGYDIETLYEALKHGANNEGPLTAVGRKGVEFYNTLGYVPYDVNINENAARTLEYAYNDFCIAQLAKKLGKPQSEVDLYVNRSRNYKNLFDKESKLMRGKNKDGSFQSPFSPFKWGDAFTEGNSWHYSWSVFQDIEGLKNLMGGNAEFIKMLDSVFVMEPVFDDSYYGGTIHEIREMQIMNMGQYAHGNQPIQHMLYLYNYAGQPWKSQYWIREAMQKLYRPTPDGYCGDEDNGQTSAWYVFSALGFYPVTPATEQYVLGTPLFNRATIQLDNGKQIVINAPNSNDKNIYVNSLMLNGAKYERNWLDHFELYKGAVLNYMMAPVPNKTRGIQKAAYPFSLSK